MTRHTIRFAALALCATALTACSAMSGDDDRTITPPPGQHAELMAPGADVTAALSQAQSLRMKGDLPGSLRIISQLMLAEPDDPRVVGEYGKLMVQQGRANDAVAFLNRALQLSPNDWSLYSALGVANDQRGDRDNARIAYEHALGLRPNEPAILNNYAMSRMLAGDPVQARALLAKAQANGGTDPKILQNIALLDAGSAKPADAAAPTDAKGFPAAPHGPAVASNTLPAPKPLAHGQVVMQDVPSDALAGPVAAHRADKADKHPKQAKNAKHGDARVASNAPAKPVKAKPGKPAKAEVPSLRMTADATKP